VAATKAFPLIEIDPLENDADFHGSGPDLQLFAVGAQFHLLGAHGGECLARAFEAQIA